MQKCNLKGYSCGATRWKTAAPIFLMGIVDCSLHLLKHTIFFFPKISTSSMTNIYRFSTFSSFPVTSSKSITSVSILFVILILSSSKFSSAICFCILSPLSGNFETVAWRIFWDQEKKIKYFERGKTKKETRNKLIIVVTKPLLVIRVLGLMIGKAKISSAWDQLNTKNVGVVKIWPMHVWWFKLKSTIFSEVAFWAS